MLFSKKNDFIKEFILSKVMQKLRGWANPKMVSEIIMEKLGKE